MRIRRGVSLMTRGLYSLLLQTLLIPGIASATKIQLHPNEVSAIKVGLGGKVLQQADQVKLVLQQSTNPG